MNLDLMEPTIISDGETMTLRLPDGATFSFKFILQQMDLRSSPEIPIMMDDPSGWKSTVLAPHRSAALSIEIVPTGPILYSEGDEDPTPIDQFEGVSVLDLFKAINRKLDKR